MITVFPNQIYQAVVSIKNTGNTTWTSAAGYALVLDGPDIWGINRVALPYVVPPNTTVTFVFQATAPSTLGEYQFNWSIAKNNVKFGIYCAQNVQVVANNTQTPTPTPTITPTKTPIATNTPTITVTPSKTPPPSLTPTVTPTPFSSPTTTPTNTPTRTPTPTQTPTLTKTPTSTPPVSPSKTPPASPTATVTATKTPPATPTATPPVTPTITTTPPNSPQPTSSPRPITNGLIAYYKFDNDLKDSSCNQYDLSPINLSDPPTYLTGKFNQDVYFNTGQSVQNAAFPALPVITVAAWVKLNPTYTGGGTSQLQTKTFDLVGNTTWTVPAGVTTLAAFVVGGGGGGGAGGTLVDTTFGVPPNFTLTNTAPLDIPAGRSYLVMGNLNTSAVINVYGNLCVNGNINASQNIIVHSGGSITWNGGTCNISPGRTVTVNAGATSYGFGTITGGGTFVLNGNLNSNIALSPCPTSYSITTYYKYYYGAGGGGGGVKYNTTFAVTPGNVINVTVGDGGAGGTAKSNGGIGGSSSFGNIVAGGGAAGFFDPTGFTNAPAGGSPTDYVGWSNGGFRGGNIVAPGVGVTLTLDNVSSTYAQGGMYGDVTATNGTNATPNTGNGGKGGGNAFNTTTFTPIEDRVGGKGGSGIVRLFYNVNVSADERSIFDYSINGISEYNFGFTNSGNTYVKKTTSGTVKLFNGGEPTINDGQWHFVVWQVDNNNFMRYKVDSSQWISGPTTNNSITNASHLLRIGLNSFQGQVDELAVWNRLLSDSELNQYANNPSSVQVCFTPTPTPTQTVTPTITPSNTRTPTPTPTITPTKSAAVNTAYCISGSQTYVVYAGQNIRIDSNTFAGCCPKDVFVQSGANLWTTGQTSCFITVNSSGNTYVTGSWNGDLNGAIFMGVTPPNPSSYLVPQCCVNPQSTLTTVYNEIWDTDNGSGYPSTVVTLKSILDFYGGPGKVKSIMLGGAIGTTPAGGLVIGFTNATTPNYNGSDYIVRFSLLSPNQLGDQFKSMSMIYTNILYINGKITGDLIIGTTLQNVGNIAGTVESKRATLENINTNKNKSISYSNLDFTNRYVLITPALQWLATINQPVNPYACINVELIQ